MRLPEFILSNMELILMEWETFARGIASGARMEALAVIVVHNGGPAIPPGGVWGLGRGVLHTPRVLHSPAWRQGREAAPESPYFLCSTI